MADVYLPGISEVFRVVPSRPEYAVSESGKVVDLRTNHIRAVADGSFIEVEREETLGRVRTLEINVNHWVKELFPKTEEGSNVDV
ncbi:hypothetical protein PP914_gp145 [Arthrobacter phage Qui]|uniref:Uncharacterized protein n=1 Tax=Arthrobacter phage Qui TaxID=2603260 RepID=A0A5B8WFZ6_9CAUD|nr:hypothetical protein PP914_gp145 [Arthrobacter phage Qui]QED11634.1 hypothetical protein SEA_QUI_145 [Arthrobacter phage Qui]QOC56466.1 hypothetical protein SEA_PAELLA_145 [Arthrobacter phage Paella]